MQVFPVNDADATARRVRAAVLRAGYECPPGNVIAVGGPATPPPAAAVVVAVLGPDPDRALAAAADLVPPGRCPVLAVGPTADTRQVLRVLRAGAADYVDAADIDNELAPALERATAGGRRAEAAKTIAVLAPSGGSGSSTVAANVAAVLAGKHASSLLIDLKLRNGDLAALLDLKPAHTLAELCQNAAGLDRTMLERSLARHPSGVHLLAPPRHYPDAEYVTADGVRQVISVSRGLFPYLVLDLDSTFGPEQVQALRLADVILLVLRLDFTCLRNARRALDYLGQLGIAAERVQVVVNRYGQPKELPAAKAEEALGVKIAHYLPDDARTVNRANNHGVPVVQDSPSARVAKSLSSLAASVNGKPHK